MESSLQNLIIYCVLVSGVSGVSKWLTFTDWSECLEHDCGGISYQFDYLAWCDDSDVLITQTTSYNRKCYTQTKDVRNRSCSNRATVTPCSSSDLIYPEPPTAVELLPCTDRDYRLEFIVKHEPLSEVVPVRFTRNFSAALVCNSPSEDGDNMWNSTWVIVGVSIAFILLIMLFGGTSCRLRSKQKEHRRRIQERERAIATQFGVNFNFAIHGQIGRQQRAASNRLGGSSRDHVEGNSRRGRTRRGRSDNRVTSPSQSSLPGNRSNRTLARTDALPPINESQNEADVQSRDSFPPSYEDSNRFFFSVTSAIPSTTATSISVITGVPPPAYDQVFDTGPSLDEHGDDSPPPYHPHNIDLDVEANISYGPGYF